MRPPAQRDAPKVPNGVDAPYSGIDVPPRRRFLFVLAFTDDHAAPAEIARDASRRAHVDRPGFDALCLDAAGCRPRWLRPVHPPDHSALML
jgi:hypothetical protein